MANDRHGARDEVHEQDPTKPFGEPSQTARMPSPMPAPTSLPTIP